MTIKNVKLVEVNISKYNYCDCFCEYTNFKYGLIEYKGLPCNNNCQYIWRKVKG